MAGTIPLIIQLPERAPMSKRMMMALVTPRMLSQMLFSISSHLTLQKKTANMPATAVAVSNRIKTTRGMAEMRGKADSADVSYTVVIAFKNKRVQNYLKFRYLQNLLEGKRGACLPEDSILKVFMILPDILHPKRTFLYSSNIEAHEKLQDGDEFGKENAVRTEERLDHDAGFSLFDA